MPQGEFKILAINPGSTSTKVAAYENEKLTAARTLRHSDAELEPFRTLPILRQLDFRRQQVERALADAGLCLGDLSAVVGRGGLLPPMESGTYLVTGEMLEELKVARRGEHASNLGAWLAHALAQPVHLPSYVVDPVSVDEWPPVARLSGCRLLDRQCLSHALNTKAVAKRYARECGRPYESLRLIVAHLGSGISISAHRDGRMIDVTNSREEGAFSTERAGSVPVMQLVDLCFSGKYSHKQVESMIFCEGGLYSYLQTKDVQEVERRIALGDEYSRMVLDAMLYQIAKEIGSMAAVLAGKVDAILFTGGMAHSQLLVNCLCESVRWISAVRIYPGEDELQALAEGALRVLRGEEQAREIVLSSSITA